MSLKTVNHIVLYKDQQYNSFPNVVMNGDGQFIAAFRQAPDREPIYGGITHLDPSSKAVFVTSDDGIVWSERASILYDDYFYGVQDPCLNRLKDGTIFATCFMWKVAEQADVEDRSEYFPAKAYGKWAGRPVGSYTIRSTDGGQTWDRPIAVSIPNLVIRGNAVELADGSLLVPFYDAKQSGSPRVVIGRTEDRGETWTVHAIITPEEGYGLYEPNLYMTPAGKLVLFSRCHKSNKQASDGQAAYPLVTAESTDGGLTWSEPVRREFYSPSPFGVLRLNDGRVLVSYGYRFAPFGIRAFILDPECGNIDRAEEVVIREDGQGGDIGYTSAIQLKDGRVLITYYYYDPGERHRYIAGTVCELV